VHGLSVCREGASITDHGPMDDGDRDNATATPRYLPGQVPEPRHALPDVPGQPDVENPEDLPRRAVADPTATPDQTSRPPSGYVIGLACFTVVSVALVAWLVFGYAGGNVTWQMLVPLVPWALVVVGLWGQVAWRSFVRR